MRLAFLCVCFTYRLRANPLTDHPVEFASGGRRVQCSGNVMCLDPVVAEINSTSARDAAHDVEMFLHGIVADASCRTPACISVAGGCWRRPFVVVRLARSPWVCSTREAVLQASPVPGHDCCQRGRGVASTRRGSAAARSLAIYQSLGCRLSRLFCLGLCIALRGAGGACAISFNHWHRSR